MLSEELAESRWTNDDVARMLESLDGLPDLVESGLDITEALDVLMERTGAKVKVPSPKDVIRDSTHAPFKRKSSLTVNAAIHGPPNPRSKVKRYTNCECSNYVCQCSTKDGGEVKIDMGKYYRSGRKASYMRNWRKKTRGR